MDITQYIGIAGALTYLLSYFLLQLSLINGNGNFYALLNMMAAFLVLISLTGAFNIGSLIIQVSFISLSVYALVNRHFSRREIATSPQEKQIADVLFPKLPHRRALKLIKKGKWQSTNQATLAEQGKPINNISILLSGSALVKKDGQTVASLNQGSIVGEVSCLDNIPATADVILNSTSHYFTIPADVLRSFLEKNEDANHAFQAGIRKQLRNKLA